MNVYVITACYNCESLLPRYVDSFKASYHKFKSKFPYADLNFRFGFVNDQVGANISVVKSLRFDGIKVSILNNNENMGANRSRNKAALYLYSSYRRGDRSEMKSTDYMIYFDADDTWDLDAVENLYKLKDTNSDFVFFPVDVTSRPINPNVRGYMPLGYFCTFVPLQEAIYAWRIDYVDKLFSEFGNLEYQDTSNSKYFPEDIQFLRDSDHEVLVLGDDSVICHRNYDDGNISTEWEEVVLKNKEAFYLLHKLHKLNMRKYQYPDTLIHYVDWLGKKCGEAKSYWDDRLRLNNLQKDIKFAIEYNEDSDNK